MTAVTDAALARLRASIQNSSSMKLSLAGKAGPLDEEHVSAPDVLEHPDKEVPLGETQRLVRTERAPEVVGDGPPELAAGRPGEEQELVVRHASNATGPAPGFCPTLRVSVQLPATEDSVRRPATLKCVRGPLRGCGGSSRRSKFLFGRYLGEWRVGVEEPARLRPPDLERLRRRVAADRAAETAAETAAEAAIRWWDELQAAADAALTEIALDDLLEQLLIAIQDMLGAEAVSVLVANEAGDTLVARGSVGLPQTARDWVRIPAGRGMAGPWVATRAPVVIDDLSTIELASPALRDSGMQSVAAVPILDEDRLLGVLHAASRELAHFHDGDVEVLVAVAARLAAAMKRVRLFESEREARARAELIADRIGRLQTITAALSGDLDHDAVCEVVSREVSPQLGGGLVSSTLWMRSGSVLRLARAESAPETAMPFLELPLDAALPGPEAVRSATPIWLTSRSEIAQSFPALASSPTFGRSFAVLPLKVEHDVLGVLALGFDRGAAFEPHEQAFFLAVTEQAAQAFDRARLRLLEARITTNNAFLAQATAALAESLDYNVTLAKIVRLLVPELADLATIHLFDEVGRLRRVALAHRDAEIEAAIRAAGEDEHPAAFLAEIVRGRTLLIEDVASAMAGSSSVSADVANALAPLHIHSVVLVPLEVAGQRVGVLSLAQLDGSRSFDPIVARLAEEIAQRSAVAIENARLHSDLRKPRRAETFLLEVATALAPRLGLRGDAGAPRRRCGADPRATSASSTSLMTTAAFDGWSPITLMRDGRLWLTSSGDGRPIRPGHIRAPM